MNLFNNLKKTVLTAILLFLGPFCVALIFALIARHISPAHIQRREGIVKQTEKAAAVPSAPSGDAGVTELLEYRNTLRQIGEPTDYANLRLWAAAGRKPTLLFSVSPPGPAQWTWSISQCGKYALAIDDTGTDSLFNEVALYSFIKEEWLWQEQLPWPEKYEDPWLFNGHLVLRSWKNNRRFAMEINESGKILSLDALGSGGPFQDDKNDNLKSKIPAFIADRANVIFASKKENSSLLAFANNPLPGIYKARAPFPIDCVSGNGLLSFIAMNGMVATFDTFTGYPLEIQQAWTPSTNTAVRALEANRNGSKVTIHLTSSFDFHKPIERNWCVIYHPDKETVETNMTNAPAYIPEPLKTEVEVVKYGLKISQAGNMLDFRLTNNPRHSIAVDLKNCIDLKNEQVQGISLLKNKRYLLIKTKSSSFLLDIYTIIHYADLLDRIEQSRLILTEHSINELMMPKRMDKSLRNVPKSENASVTGDSFNYEMNEYDTYFVSPTKLEPPSMPSILSLQAEFLATHQAWLYAAHKLDRLMALQEHDHRAPKANPLLLARYATLAEDDKTARRACEKGLSLLFFDNSPYNKMIRWQFEQRLFFTEQKQTPKIIK